jgi:hypothetical protein
MGSLKEEGHRCSPRLLVAGKRCSAERPIRVRTGRTGHSLGLLKVELDRNHSGRQMIHAQKSEHHRPHTHQVRASVDCLVDSEEHRPEDTELCRS